MACPGQAVACMHACMHAPPYQAPDSMLCDIRLQITDINVDVPIAAVNVDG